MGIRDFLFNTEVDDALAFTQGQRVRNTEQAIGPVTQDQYQALRRAVGAYSKP
jgi:hypothetical protein